MRYTENRNGVWVIPKRFHDAAVEKLAGYEDTGLKPEQVAEIQKLHANRCNDVVRLKDALRKILAFLDEIDGQIIDDPVSVIREKLEELL